LTNSRSVLIFFVGAALLYVASALIAGIFGYAVFNEGQYYPPSANALPFLGPIPSQSVILPAEALHGFLIALVLFPFRKRMQELGRLYGGLATAFLIFALGELSDVIEQSLYYKPLPLGFVAASVVEILIQALLFGQLLFILEKRYGHFASVR
jgi:hypothetical protein